MLHYWANRKSKTISMGFKMDQPVHMIMRVYSIFMGHLLFIIGFHFCCRIWIKCANKSRVNCDDDRCTITWFRLFMKNLHKISGLHFSWILNGTHHHSHSNTSFGQSKWSLQFKNVCDFKSITANVNKTDEQIH